MRTLLGKEVFWAHMQTAKMMTLMSTVLNKDDPVPHSTDLPAHRGPEKVCESVTMEGAVTRLPVPDSFLSLPKQLTRTVLPGSLPK